MARDVEGSVRWHAVALLGSRHCETQLLCSSSRLDDTVLIVLYFLRISIHRADWWSTGRRFKQSRIFSSKYSVCCS